MEDIKLIYENYEINVLINYFTSIIIKNNNEKGKFSFDNDILKIIWDNKKEDFFIKDTKKLDDSYYSYIYISQYQDYKNKEINIKCDEILEIQNNIKKINIFYKNIIHIFNIDEINNKIINFEDNNITFDIFYLDSMLLIKINNDYYNIFEINDNIYYDTTEKYNIKLEIIHNTWNDFVIINKFNNLLYRESNINEKGNFKFDNDENLLIIFWEKWDSEKFIKKNNNIYQIINKEVITEEVITEEVITEEVITEEIITEEVITDQIINKEVISEENNKLKEIYIYHNDWNDYLILEDNIIYRKYNKNEYGNYEIKDNILEIVWKLWNKELFYYFNDNNTLFFYEKYIKKLEYNDKYYLINNFNNNIYDTYFNKLCTCEFNKNKIILNINNKLEHHDFIEYNNSIIIYQNIFKEIILIKDFEEKFILNNLNNKITNEKNNKNGSVIIYNNINKITILWDELTVSEDYVINENIYYYKYYFDNNHSDYIIYDNNENITLKIDFFNKFFYNSDIKYNFIKYENYYYILINDVLKNYYLNTVYENNIKYNLLINNEIIQNIDDTLNIIIYKEFNKDLENYNIIEIYNHWLNIGIKENYIYSIKSFLYQYDYFNIEQYMKNNNIKNKLNALLHYNQNNLLGDYFYSDNNFDILINKIFTKYKFQNENYDENEIYKLKYNNNNDDLLIILIINNEDELEKLKFFNNNDNIVIIINFQSSKLDNFEKYLIKNYNNLILIKSRINNNDLIFKNIFKYLLENKIYYYKVLYINNFNDILCKEDINNIKKLKLIIKKNYFYDLIKFCFSKIDILKILLFYVIIEITNNKKIFNNNFITKFIYLKNLNNNIFSNKIFFLR